MNERVAIESFRPHWERIVKVGHTRFRESAEPSKTEAYTGGGGNRGFRGKDRYGGLYSIHGRFDVLAFCFWLGITKDEYDSLEKAMRNPSPATTIDGRLADRILTAVGRPEIYGTLYFPPLTDGRNRDSLKP